MSSPCILCGALIAWPCQECATSLPSSDGRATHVCERKECQDEHAANHRRQERAAPRMANFDDLHRMVRAQAAHYLSSFRSLPVEIQALGCCPEVLARILLDWIAANVEPTERESIAAEVSRALGH